MAIRFLPTVGESAGCEIFGSRTEIENFGDYRGQAVSATSAILSSAA
jgi:hypothetical protein